MELTTDFRPFLGALAGGQAHSFSEFEGTAADIPMSAGVYTIWDSEGVLVYVGIAGRSKSPTTPGLRGRLKSHANGKRSGDQFCCYVADHYVLPDLTLDDLRRVMGEVLRKVG